MRSLSPLNSTNFIGDEAYLNVLESAKIGPLRAK